MRIQYHRYGYKNVRELNIHVGSWQFRVARYQLALWRNCEPVFNFLG